MLGVLHLNNGLSFVPVSPPLDEHNKSRRKQKSKEAKETQRKTHQNKDNRTVFNSTDTHPVYVYAPVS